MTRERLEGVFAFLKVPFPAFRSSGVELEEWQGSVRARCAVPLAEGDGLLSGGRLYVVRSPSPKNPRSARVERVDWRSFLKHHWARAKLPMREADMAAECGALAACLAQGETTDPSRIEVPASYLFPPPEGERKETRRHFISMDGKVVLY